MYETQTEQQLHQFIVTRDGQLDDEYYDNIYLERKREILHQTVHRAVHNVIDLPGIVGKNIVGLIAEQVRQELLGRGDNGSAVAGR